MQKKLLALAVASVLAAPTVAMAQSAVTISGFLKVGIDNYSIGSAAPVRAGLNTSETRITDNSSRMIFGIVEDIGGGLSGIAQVDMRFAPDNPAAGAGALNSNGNTWVGLRSTSLGTVTLGRHDLHYGKQPDDIAAKAGALQAAATSLMDYVARGGTANAIAGATRTSNVLRYDSPNWSGFAFTAAYSANPTAAEADLTTGARKGNAYTFNPTYTASNFGVGWSYWNQKADAPTATSASNQKANVFYGYWTGGGFNVGAAINDSKIETSGGTKLFDRRSWTIPVSWTSGSHNIYAHYTKAKEDKVLGGGSDAKMIAVAYVYDLSKRTSVGLTYAKIDNGALAAYNFHNISAGGLNNLVNNGEDPRLVALIVRHAF
jgi:predicted porin